MNDFNMYSGGGYGGYGGSCGVYTANSQFSLDEKKMLDLKFTQVEIDTLKWVVQNCGNVTTNRAMQMGYNPETAKKLKYMYDIATGMVDISTTDDLCKHLRKMFGGHGRIGIQHLPKSKFEIIPRKCFVGNIPAGTFEMYNSKHYGRDGLYDVTNVTGGKIEFRTARKPVLKYRESKELPGIIEITNLNKDGTVTVEVNKQYARLCSRYIILASLKRPEFYHAMVEIICIEGTKVYVFATTMKDGEKPNYKGGTQRVYDFGFFKNELPRKLLNVASIVYANLNGVYAEKIPGNMEFEMFKQSAPEETDEDVIE